MKASIFRASACSLQLACVHGATLQLHLRHSVFPKLDLTSLPTGNLHHLHVCRFIHNQNRRRSHRRHRYSAYLSHAVLACPNVIPEHSGHRHTCVPFQLEAPWSYWGLVSIFISALIPTQTPPKRSLTSKAGLMHSPNFSHPPTCRSSNGMRPKTSVAVLYPTRKSALSSSVKGSLACLCSPIGSPLVVAQL